MKVTCVSFLLLIGTALFSSSEAMAQVAVTKDIYGKEITFLMSSEHTGDEHPVSVYLPPGYEPDSNRAYPILILLDSNLLFGQARTVINLFTLEGSINPPVLVGIGYPEDDFETFMAKRLRYFGSAAEKDNQGARGFSAFLRGELLPRVTADYNLDPEHLTLFAEALPGIFGVYELFDLSSPFNHFILVGPRLWTNDGAIFQHEQAFSQVHDELSATVYLSIGLQDKQAYVDAWHRFVKVLARRDYKGLAVETDIMQDAGHFSGIMKGLINGIHHIYKIDTK